MTVGFAFDANWLQCSHGPQAWPHWWIRFRLSFVKLDVAPPSTAYGVWIYTRSGGRRFDVYFRRGRFPRQAR